MYTQSIFRYVHFIRRIRNVKYAEHQKLNITWRNGNPWQSDMYTPWRALYQCFAILPLHRNQIFGMSFGKEKPFRGS